MSRIGVTTPSSNPIQRVQPANSLTPSQGQGVYGDKTLKRLNISLAAVGIQTFQVGGNGLIYFDSTNDSDRVDVIMVGAINADDPLPWGPGNYIFGKPFSSLSFNVKTAVAGATAVFAYFTDAPGDELYVGFNKG